MKHYYKKILLVFFFLFQFSFLKAQWVTIPDTNFVNWLDANGYAGCMNGNLMDTTCGTIMNATKVNCNNSNIYDLDGIQYFDNLDTLLCQSDSLTNLPTLPKKLSILGCENNGLTTLSVLPDSLKYLDCSFNQLTNLPQLPSTLMIVDCQFNQLTYLPNLPNSLTSLSCGVNQIYSIPPLPNSLIYFSCNSNNLTSLPPIPSSLVTLSCGSNSLSILPTLPNSLYLLECSLNPLFSLPTLPNALAVLVCGNDSLNALPSLPSSLYDLRCPFNQLSSLPVLPALTFLDCSSNNFANLPLLPPTLNTLYCDNNYLTSLSALPNSLTNLKCYNNQLTSLPSLPDSLYSLEIQNNPLLTCLPELKRIYSLNFFNTSVQCIPNYGNISFSYPLISSVPLCDLFNTNNCTAYWNISGKVYNDTNSDCIADANELRLPNIKLMLDSAGTLIQQTYTGGEGFYSFDTDTGTYTYTVDTTDIPVLVTCPAAGFQTSVLTAIDSMDYDMDFGMQCKPGFDVGVTSVVRDSGIFRPANFARVKIAAGDISNFYGLHCAAGTSGSVQVVFSGAVAYIGNAAGSLTPVISGDTLLYSVADFGTVNFNSDFNILMQIETTAAIGSQICFDVNVSPLAGDINTGNNSLNYCFTVVGSIDPNTKEVFPGGNIDTAQHWLTYTINFQNTGTAPAEHIYILDTLDNSLDESSFTLLSYSHQPLTQVVGKVVRFNFPNINLPDSTSDEPNSHGYVQYKIKIKTGLTNGTLIHNTANIYFDFNSPIATNTTENQILITTGINEFKVQSLKFKVVPNPFHSSTLLKIDSPLKSNNYYLEIYDLLGNMVREISADDKNEIIIERKNLDPGIYIFKLFNEKELAGTGKLVVQ